jgi:hypothetical protein
MVEFPFANAASNVTTYNFDTENKLLSVTDANSHAMIFITAAIRSIVEN